MHAPASPLPFPVVVSRLRAAGCVFAEDEATLLVSAAGSAPELAAMLHRREAGAPLELVLGWAEFGGLRIEVEAGVFVPRRRSEFLVAQAGALARPGAVVLDLCCGSGALGAALAASVPGIELHAADLDPAAVRCARRNLAAAGGRVYEGDLYAPLPAALAGRVAVLVANVPYVPSDAIALLPTEARDHEPDLALNGGPDGLDILRRVAAGAPHWLAPGGTLMIETSARQAPEAESAFQSAGLHAITTHSPDLGATVIRGSRQGVAAISRS